MFMYICYVYQLSITVVTEYDFGYS